MNHKRPPVPAIVVVLLLIAISVYFFVTQAQNQQNGTLTASGTIETINVNIAPELAGKVTEVLADEGDTVDAGSPLLQLDDSLLTAQRAVAATQLDSAIAGFQTAQSALDTANFQYQIALDAALEQDKTSRLQDWFRDDPNQFEQPGWYFTRDEQIVAAQSKVDMAQTALEDAQANLTKVTQSLDASDFLQAEERLLNARLGYLITKDVDNRAENSVTSDVPVGRYNATHCGTNQGYFVNNARLTNLVYGCRGDEHLSDASQTLYDEAKDELDKAQQEYNDLLTTDAADKVLQARADVSVAQEHYYAAFDFLRALQKGDQSTGVAAAEGMVKQAQSAVDQAQKTIEQAQASLDLLETQIAKLTVNAPTDGVILTRNVEPGEFIQPGATALVLGQLSNLSITVYVPEDRYGEVSLGQSASMTVDSFPGATFQASVVNIADQAEFTPRNVQTVEGRSSTVYAVKLKVEDPEGKLKPGMPADVVFH